MNNDARGRLIANLLAMLHFDSFDKVILSALHELCLSKRRIILLLLLSPLTFYISYCVGFIDDSIEKATFVIESTNTIALSLLAIVLTGYAIFQALVAGATLRNFLSQETEKKNLFKSYNDFFFLIAIQYLFLVIINYILILFLKVIPGNWSAPYISDYNNNLITTVFLGLYLLYTINSFLEMKCFIYNLYQCFTTNAIAQAADFLLKENPVENKHFKK